jgi:hypothetical protein
VQYVHIGTGARSGGIKLELKDFASFRLVQHSIPALLGGEKERLKERQTRLTVQYLEDIDGAINFEKWASLSQ